MGAVQPLFYLRVWFLWVVGGLRLVGEDEGGLGGRGGVFVLY